MPMMPLKNGDKINTFISNVIGGYSETQKSRINEIFKAYGASSEAINNFMSAYKDAVNNFIFQNYLSNMIDKKGNIVSVPTEFNKQEVKIDLSLPTDVEIRDGVFIVNSKRIKQDFTEKKYLATDNEVNNYSSREGLEAFTESNDVFPTEESYFKYVLEREYLFNKGLRGTELNQEALMNVFNYASIMLPGKYSFTDQVLEVINKHKKTLSRGYGIIEQIRGYVEKSDLNLLTLSDRDVLTGDTATSYATELKALANPRIQKVADPEENLKISKLFALFPLMMVYQHGYGQTIAGFELVLPTEKVLSKMKAAGALFKNNYDNAKTYNIIFSKLVATKSRFPNYIVTAEQYNQYKPEVPEEVETDDSALDPENEVNIPIKKAITSTISNPADFTNHSGGAYGGDTFWDIIGREFGVTKHMHYKDAGNANLSQKLKNAGVTATVLTKEQMDTARTEVENLLGKKYPDTLEGNLQVRNYYQVANADGVFAIAKLSSDKVAVSGGTNTAVQLGIEMNKPTYVWDITTESWYKYNGDTFEVTETPTLTKNFAGIGSRDIENYNTKDKDGKWTPRKEYLGAAKEAAAKKAIKDVYENTFKSTTQPSTSVNEFDVADKLTAIEQNFTDGQGGRQMQDKFKGKSTMDLIISGDRTRTTRAKTDIQRMAKDYGLSKISDLVGKVIRMTDKTGRQVYTRITKVAPFTQEYQDTTWQKEGWIKSVTDKHVGDYPYAIEFEVVSKSTQPSTIPEIVAAGTSPYRGRFTIGSSFLGNATAYVESNTKLKDAIQKAISESNDSILSGVLNSSLQLLDKNILERNIFLSRDLYVEDSSGNLGVSAAIEFVGLRRTKKEGTLSQRQIQTMAHELTHMMTLQPFIKESDNVPLTAKEKEFLTEMRALYNYVKELPESNNKDYFNPMRDEYEFIADALADSKFREYLNSIEYSKGKSTLTKLIEIIKKLLGVKTGSALETVVDQVYSLKEDPSFKHYDTLHHLIDEMRMPERKSNLKKQSIDQPSTSVSIDNNTKTPIKGINERLDSYGNAKVVLPSNFYEGARPAGRLNSFKSSIDKVADNIQILANLNLNEFDFLSAEDKQRLEKLKPLAEELNKINANDISSDDRRTVAVEKRFAALTNQLANEFVDIIGKHVEQQLGKRITSSKPRITTQPQTPVAEVKATDQFKYFGSMYTIKLDNGVGVDVEGYKGKADAKAKLLNAYNENPNVDPQNGREFRQTYTPPVESAIPGEYSFTFANGFVIDTPFLLNSEQQSALLRMEDFLNDSEKYNNEIALIGYAGTGKTTIISLFDKYIRSKGGRRPKYSSPTHRANAVTKMNNPNANVQTLHKLFGLQPQLEIDKLGELSLEDIKSKQTNQVNISGGDLLIIDESSMISDTLYQFIRDNKEKLGIKVIYLGDPAQLAPVDKTKKTALSVALETPFKMNLTKVERTNDNPILFESTALREGKPLSMVSAEVNGRGVEYISNAARTNQVIATALEEMVISKDYLHFRLLSGTNANVNTLNDKARKILFNADSSTGIQEGEILMGYDNFNLKDDDYTIFNSGDYLVKSVSAERTKSVNLLGDEKATFVGNEVLLQSLLEPDKSPESVFIAKKGPVNTEAGKKLLNAKVELIKLANSAPTRQLRGMYFSRQFDILSQVALMEPVLNSYGTPAIKATLNYGYAHTIHKSQGGTYSKVLILLDSINNTKFDPIVKQQLKYVAVSRATDYVYVVTGQNINTSDTDFDTVTPSTDDKIISSFKVPAKASTELSMKDSDIAQIFDGTKVVTNRTGVFADGTYVVGGVQEIELKYIGEGNVVGNNVTIINPKTKKSFIRTKDEFAKAEGFKNWTDFEKNNSFSKNFLAGKESRNIYSVKPLGEIKEVLGANQSLDPENNPAIAAFNQELIKTNGIPPKVFTFQNGPYTNKYVLNKNNLYNLVDKDNGSIFVANINLQTGEIVNDDLPSTPVDKQKVERYINNLRKQIINFRIDLILADKGIDIKVVIDNLENVSTEDQFNEIASELIKNMC
jgi:hypothetical protein